MNRNESPDQIEWDAVIIGTGMGGAVLGYALARAGWRVVFVEKGKSHLHNADALRGGFAESFFRRAEAPQAKHRAMLERAGRCADEITDMSGVNARRFIPFIGSGTGGSSALYGMALERFLPSDFACWPVQFEELAPHYSAAERLFRVRSESGIPPLHPANRELKEYLLSHGLHPYRLPVACEYERGSDRTQGFLDATGAKNDAASICLRPALENFGAELLDECVVKRIEASRSRVTEIHCERHGRPLVIRGSVIVLAAGALATPCLLLKSASHLWPNGLANSSGLVGRNLMRHFVDLYLVKAYGGDVRQGNLKELAFNDWYELDGVKYGTVQSFGPLPPVRQIVAELEHDLRRSRWSVLAPLFCIGAPLLKSILERKLAGRLVLASILEDAPREENLVRPGQAGEAPIVLEYKIRKSDSQRIVAIRAKMMRLLSSLGVILIKQAENNERIAHACGTCRFGDDPHASVLDPFCRAHGLENLYVVDASFFPSSGGTNPGLTVAANALRVAARLISRSKINKPVAEYAISR